MYKYFDIAYKFEISRPKYLFLWCLFLTIKRVQKRGIWKGGDFFTMRSIKNIPKSIYFTLLVCCIKGARHNYLITLVSIFCFCNLTNDCRYDQMMPVIFVLFLYALWLLANVIQAFLNLFPRIFHKIFLVTFSNVIKVYWSFRGFFHFCDNSNIPFPILICSPFLKYFI